VPASPACSQIIYQSLFSDQTVSKTQAEIFLWGILGDTGNFAYLKPYQTETLVIAKKLMEISGIEIQEFLSRYQTISQTILSIVLEFIKNTQYISDSVWPSFQYSYLDRKFVEEKQIYDNQISEASHIYGTEYVRTITGYPWGFVITPRIDGDVNISCRSLPKSVNVREFMEKMGIGGGHDRASGGTFRHTGSQPLDVAPCIEETLTWIKNNSPILG
jgi:nanoRNase/pAp phosphatase (c-di-AMP/oligoRNAs hydrolase)